MDDELDPTLDALKVRGERALRDARSIIANLRDVARVANECARYEIRGVRMYKDVVARNAK